MMPGIPECRTHSYVRHGTTSLFAALDIASGFVIGKCYNRHRAVEFLDFLKQIEIQASGGTQKALSDGLGVDRAYVSALERGLRNPAVVTLYRIAEVLGVPFARLFETPEGGEPPTKAPKERQLKQGGNQRGNA